MPRASRTFVPSDTSAAELRLRTKFGDAETGALIERATTFVLKETAPTSVGGEPFRRYLNDKRVEKLDAALSQLIRAMKVLPNELRHELPPWPAENELPHSLRQVLLAGRDEEHPPALYAAYEALTFVEIDNLGLLLAALRFGLGIEGNESDPSDLKSVLAARSRRVRFVAEVITDRMERGQGAPEISGRDLALLAIRSDLETHRPDIDFDVIIDRWKKALGRAKELLEEVQANKPAHRRRAARRSR